MGLIKFFSGARVAVATVFLTVTLISIIIGGPALAAFLAVLIYFGTQELVNFAKAKGLNPPFRLIILVDFILLALAGLGLYSYFGLVLTLSIIASFITILFRGKAATINDLSATLLCILYGGWLPMHLIMLRDLNNAGINIFGFNFSDGFGYFILIFFIITLNDIAAYYVGSKFGKTPLWPEVSPKKTVEGAVAGIVSGVIIAIIIGFLINLPIYHSIIAGIILSLTSQFGDLSESMLKRDAGFKDSGNILPGHGGVLDRADSYIFTGAVAYYYFTLFVLGNSSVLNLLP